jgi:hypothetical protein
MKWMSVFALFVFLGGVASAQDAPKSDLKPSEVQSLRLQVKLKDAIISSQNLAALQQAVQKSQQDLNQALAALDAEANAVKKENGWDDSIVFDRQTATFSKKPDGAKTEKR